MTDRVEDVVAWILISVALLAVVAAATVGARTYGEGMHRVEVEGRERTRVQAVLLEPAGYALTGDDEDPAVRALPVNVPARYTAPDGVERQTSARVQGPLAAGAVVPIWVDRSGAVVGAPTDGVQVVTDAVTTTVGIVAFGAVALYGVWAAVRSAVLHVDLARWGREWEQVEPRWSERTP